jgi:branched-chain amino acid transport system ATP-binding protein
MNSRGDTTTNCLTTSAISVAFGGFKALSEVSLTITPGAVHGLIGPNGAGKTTVVNVLTGFQTPTSGEVALNGRALGVLSAHALRRAGVARTFQAGRLFAGLSVIDNLTVTGIGLGNSRKTAEAEADRILDWMGVSYLAALPASGLPYTDERRVGIARALMFNPTYLLLDEPAAGMSEAEATDLAALISRIASERGTGVLLIEHNVSLVLSVSHHIYVLDAGRIIEEGDRDVIIASKRVRDAYFGADQEAA